MQTTAQRASEHCASHAAARPARPALRGATPSSQPVRRRAGAPLPAAPLRAPGVAAAAGKGFGAAPAAAPAPAPDRPAACPCGSGGLYKACCGRFHEGSAVPATAEELMRSRYSAYARGLAAYVVATTHPENPLAAAADGELAKDVRATCDKISWDKLKVLGARAGADGNEAFVEFQTWFKVRGQKGQRAQGFHTQSFTEDSRFLRVDGRWLYVNGEQTWITR